MISRLGPMVGTVVVAVIPPGPSAQMAIAEAAGPCPEDTAFCRERNPPMPTRGANGLTFRWRSRSGGGVKTAPRYFGQRPEVACGGPAPQALNFWPWLRSSSGGAS